MSGDGGESSRRTPDLLTLLLVIGIYWDEALVHVMELFEGGRTSREGEHLEHFLFERRCTISAPISSGWKPQTRLFPLQFKEISEEGS